MSSAEPAPLLVLGLGNTLLSDDGVGVALLEALRGESDGDARVEFVDGGTQGLALLGYLERRRAALVLDAVALGAPAGHVHALGDAHERANPRGLGPHGGNASELFAAARLVGCLPPRVELVGVEPASLATGNALSECVACAMPRALARARRSLAELLELIEREEAACTS